VALSRATQTSPASLNVYFARSTTYRSFARPVIVE
jgi:hypothetical protein